MQSHGFALSLGLRLGLSLGLSLGLGLCFGLGLCLGLGLGLGLGLAMGLGLGLGLGFGLGHGLGLGLGHRPGPAPGQAGIGQMENMVALIVDNPWAKLQLTPGVPDAHVPSSSQLAIKKILHDDDVQILGSWGTAGNRTCSQTVGRGANTLKPHVRLGGALGF